MLLSQDQTAERFLFTGYAPVKRPSAQVLRIGGLIMGQTKNKRGRASAGPEDPAAVGPLYGKDERNTAGADSSAAEHHRNHNRELMEACRDLKDYAEYVDRVRKYVRELPLVRGGGTCHYRVYPERNPERVSGEEPGGGEDYSRRTGKLLQKRTRRWRSITLMS